jgi:glycolate oxidase
MIERVTAIGTRCDLPIACYGHAGDGNLHVNILLDGDYTVDPMKSRIDRALRELFENTIELRGTLSGEHGIGLAKKDFMPLEQSERVLEWQRKWKAMWDPKELLNPGKVLPDRPQICKE